MSDRISRLDLDARGYRIPWNVVRGLDGRAIFTVNDDRKYWVALQDHLCPICGEALGRWKWFIGGPGSAFHEHGWYLDLPTHLECAEYSLATCPYLALPRYLGRTDVVDPANLPPEHRLLIDNTVSPQRPDLFVAVASTEVRIKLNEPPSLPYVRPSRPALAYDFWRHGHRISAADAVPLIRAVLGAEWNLPATAT